MGQTGMKLRTQPQGVPKQQGYPRSEKLKTFFCKKPKPRVTFSLFTRSKQKWLFWKADF